MGKKYKEQSYKRIRNSIIINGVVYLLLMVLFIIILVLFTNNEGVSIGQHFMEMIKSDMKWIFIALFAESVLFLTVVIITSKRMMEQIQITNEQLQEETLKAEAANEAKTVFLANMSHEIRTPLNAIIGFSDILNASEMDATEKEYAGIVARSAKSLLAIINDILDISKIESDVFDINNESFEIEPFLEQIVELYSVKSDEKKVQLSYLFDESIPPYIVGDSFRLQQVISNLLSNAIKFTPQKGEVQFKALLKHSDEEKVTIRFAVKDNGIGISEEGQKKIFEPFTQADNSITRKFGGTGLGLSISRQIVDAMNSSLQIQSKVNEGSMFSFDVDFQVDNTKCKVAYQHDDLVFGIFPSKPNDEEMRDRLISVLSNYGKVIKNVGERYYENVDYLIGVEVDNIYLEAKRMREMYNNIPVIYANKELNLSQSDTKIFFEIVREPFYKSKIERIINRLKHNGSTNSKRRNEQVGFDGTVLVAEDNSTNQILMRVLLERLGVTMVFADNGIEAVQKFKENDIDIVLMDVHMPILDGIGAMEKLRGLSKGGHVPIVALTADALQGDREKYMSLGFDEYMSKPVEYNNVLAVFYKYLQLSETVKKGYLIGDLKGVEDLSKGVLVNDKPDTNEKADEKKEEKKSVSNITSEYNGDQSLSFKERVAYNNKMKVKTVTDLSKPLKARIAERDMINVEAVVEEPAKKLTTLDNYLHKNNPNPAIELKARGTTKMSGEEKEKKEKNKDGFITIVDYDYDKVRACKHIGVDEVTLDMLLDNFGLSHSRDLEKIEKALEKGDLDEIIKSAHYLKGSAANLRMVSLVELLKEVENNAKDGIISKVDFNSIKKYIENIIMK